jgi:hypothetical protein
VGGGSRRERPDAGVVTNWFGTCLSNGNGKILRVELDGGIPADNPLASVASVTACDTTLCPQSEPSGTAPPRKEIYAWGFRNPWRIWFDTTTGNLWVLLVNATVRNETVLSKIAGTGLTESAFLMFFFAAFAVIVALIFGWYARRYPMQDHYRDAGAQH